MSDTSSQVANAAGYLFAPLPEVRRLRLAVKDLCSSLNLRGTVTLSPEGVNCGIAGQESDVRTFADELQKVLDTPKITFKISFSKEAPFDRMLVKVKPKLLPAEESVWDKETSQRTQLPGKVLKQWLDEGRDIVLLDTRNSYEFDVGSFDNAIPLSITNFRSFEAEARSHLPEWRDKTIVTFCTGGIRCEVAVPAMIKRLGFRDVYQLQGGILQYFEDIGGDHWHGDCFVFDKRVGVDHALRPRPRPFCPDCGKPTHAGQTDCRYCGSEHGVWPTAEVPPSTDSATNVVRN